MDGTIVLAVALALGSLLLWSLLILVEDMIDRRRKRTSRQQAVRAMGTPDDPPRHARTTQTGFARSAAPAPASARYDERFEQLVDQWFSFEGGREPSPLELPPSRRLPGAFGRSRGGASGAFDGRDDDG